MKKINLLLLFAGVLVMANTAVFAQSKIKDGTVTGTSNLPNTDAVMEFESNNKGVLLPRVALTAINEASPLANHVAGMLVYNTATDGTAPHNVIPGFYYNTGTGWAQIMETASYFKQDLLSGGDAADAITTPVTVISAGGSPSKKTIGTRQFNLSRESLVTLSYQVSCSNIGSSNGGSITDGRAKLYGIVLSFSELPASAPLAANQQFSQTTASFSSASNGGYVSGYFYLNGAPQLKLPAGTYTLKVEGFAFVTNSDTQGIRVQFGDDVTDRIDITAAPL